MLRRFDHDLRTSERYLECARISYDEIIRTEYNAKDTVWRKWGFCGARRNAPLAIARTVADYQLFYGYGDQEAWCVASFK